MVDMRIKQLADLLVTYSVEVKKGDNVLIESFDLAPEIIDVLVTRVTEAGGNPYVKYNSSKVIRSLWMNQSEEACKVQYEHELTFMKKMNCYIAIRNYDNSFEYSDVPVDQMKMVRMISRPVIDWRVKNTRWCVLRWPSASMAQAASMSTSAFEDFYFNVCAAVDYRKLSKAMDSLVDLMNKTDSVRLTAKDTDLIFSIKDIPAIKCDGKMNIPDGEVFTAPVKEKVQGRITFNAPTVYDGKRFENISLLFADGKIVDATGSNTDALNAILDTDEGSRFVGEFAIGVNPLVTHPMCDILFDEKISGSIHFTPGACYDEASNGNKSAIHWDMVLIQTPEYGGGCIYFDDVLIRKDGIFVVEELKALNPTELLGV